MNVILDLRLPINKLSRSAARLWRCAFVPAASLLVCYRPLANRSACKPLHSLLCLLYAPQEPLVRARDVHRQLSQPYAIDATPSLAEQPHCTRSASSASPRRARTSRAKARKTGAMVVSSAYQAAALMSVISFAGAMLVFVGCGRLPSKFGIDDEKAVSFFDATCLTLAAAAMIGDACLHLIPSGEGTDEETADG